MHWGDLATLEYGKGLRGYENGKGAYRVFGTNGPIGWHDEPLCRHSTVVIGRKGAYRGVHYSAEPCFVIDTAFYLEPRTAFDMRWAYYQLLTHDINTMDSGSAIPSTSRDSFYGLPVRVPGDIDEQRAIAHILGTLDDKIELNRRINQTLEEIARAIFKSWFVDFEPVHAKASGEPPESICRRLGLTPELLAHFPDGLQNSELSQIPEGWEVTTLGDLCERVSMGPFGSDIKTSNFVKEGVPIIRGSSLTDGFVDDEFVFLTEAKADELRNANARGGDIVITHRGTLGQVGLIPIGSRYPRYVVSQSQMVLTPKKERTTSRFIYEFLRSPAGQQALLANTSQVGVPAIARPTTSIRAISLVAPQPELLQTYDSVVDPLFNHVLSASRESNILATLRDALLPKLLSGELQMPLEGET